jgi:hypothetical protein
MSREKRRGKNEKTKHRQSSVCKKRSRAETRLKSNIKEIIRRRRLYSNLRKK